MWISIQLFIFSHCLYWIENEKFAEVSNYCEDSFGLFYIDWIFIWFRDISTKCWYGKWALLLENRFSQVNWNDSLDFQPNGFNFDSKFDEFGLKDNAKHGNSWAPLKMCFTCYLFSAIQWFHLFLVEHDGFLILKISFKLIVIIRSNKSRFIHQHFLVVSSGA